MLRDLKHRVGKGELGGSGASVYTEANGFAPGSPFWAKSAADALTIKPTFKSPFGGVEVPDPLSEPMRRLFSDFNMDPANPYDWRTLVGYLAVIYYWKPPSKEAGAPRRWTPEANAALRKLIDRYGDLPNKEVARRAARLKELQFAGPEALRIRIGQMKRAGVRK
jgi:hypothetical protein